MVKLTLIEKKKLEKLFEMDSGWVLDFNDARFAEFFKEMGVNINDLKYTTEKTSRSKANRLRGFWENEKNSKVGTVLEKLIEYAEYLKGENGKNLTVEDKRLVSDCRTITNKLTGKPAKMNSTTSNNDFLATDFGKIDLSKLPGESRLQPILDNLFNEAKICLKNNANLACIFMAGSILEGILLGAAQSYPKKFSKSNSCPKNDDGKPKQFHEWTLSQFIDAGREINILGEDVKKFSHVLRDFRNYIHPYRQMTSGFKPDRNTAEICLQVLKAAILDLIKNKPNE